MSRILVDGPAQYVSTRGASDGRATPVLALRSTAPGRPSRHVAAPDGEQWTGSFAAGGGVIAAITHVPGASGPASRLYVFSPSNGAAVGDPRLRAVPLPPVRTSPVEVKAVSRDGALAVVVFDAGWDGGEKCAVVPLAEGGPARTWQASRTTSHVLDASFGPGGEVVLAVAGVPSAPQHRRILRHDLTGWPSEGTVLLEDGDHGVFQIHAADLSPDGSLLAVAETRDDGATFAVSVTPVSGGPRRVLYQRPVSWADPTEVDLSFDGTGAHLLVGHGEICRIDVADGTCRVLARCDEEHWMRVGW
ncbi:hypothetical protein Sme01_15950 [Sphaerisporangium melleum]|uniref:Uncharacterized protein n=1 Tax=Sphaerisporangium melleum TaxID=321316 RepID=A0A917RKI6_9ACTN|nr:hypothetical protein [Sphaerisporangium melleum]GGL10684.1 hypothetical protein GCM10007964_61090 [Sphaerisporangium melleum]GII69119.1 hypothetical protein Sme01_15950 [Sphaerisporangium melleum]